jgi:ELWxxDGT repeat protein
MSPLGAAVIFSADDGVHGREPWITDGTAAGTRLLKDIRPGPEGSDPITGGEIEFNPVPADARRRFTQVGDALYFVADDGLHGREIWTTDGSPEGTRLLRDLTEGPEEWGIASFLTAHDGKLFFMGDDGLDGEELWISDGSMAGTRPVADIMEGPAGSLPSHLVSTPLGLAFAAEHFDYGVEPWISDGTAEGTRMLGDLVPDLDGSDPSSFIGFEGAIYFAASDQLDGANTEPWVSDGSPEGTHMLRDLNPSGRGFNLGYHRHLDRLYFGGDDGQSGSELWSTDGSPEGTVAVADVAIRGRGSVPSGFASFGDLLFFKAFPFSYGIEPWLSDGSSEGTRLLLDVNPGEVASSLPAEASQLGERLYFSAERSDSGRELWSTNGSPAGTRIFADIFAGPGSSNPTDLLAHAGRLYLAAGDDQLGRELGLVSEGDGVATESPPTATVTATRVAPDLTETPEGSTLYLPFTDRSNQP